MSHWILSVLRRGLALFQIALLLSAGCSGGPLTATPGVAEHQAPGMIRVPGAVVNAAGGNLLVERIDITLDSIVGGTQVVGAVYNSSLPGWTWSFGARYDGATFTDASGREFAVAALADGAAIPGSQWVKVNAYSVQTKGGLAQYFDAQGRLAVVRWATLDYPRIRYTWSESLLDLAQCTAATVCAAFYQIALDTSGRPASVTDVRGGRRVELVWDAAGHLAVAKSPLEVAKNWPGTRYEYTPFGRLTAITNSEGERIEYAYQSGGRILSVTQIGEGNPTHRFEFYSADRNGLYETLHTNPLGARTRLHFDANSRLREVEWVETGDLTTLTWDGLRMSSETRPNGATTTYTYVGDELFAKTEPSGNVVRYFYEPNGLNFEAPSARAKSRVEDNIGLVEERLYDALGRQIKVSNGAGESSVFGYGAVSQVVSETLPSGETRAYTLHGVHGHWREMTLPNGLKEKRVFDSTGNERVGLSGQRRGGELTREFDGNRNLALVHVAGIAGGLVSSEGVISIARRSDGQPLTLTRPGGGDHAFGYDTLGRRVSESEKVDGQWQTTTFAYDRAGNLTARSRPNSMREEFSYDGYSRLTRRAGLRSGALEGEAIFTHANGSLVAVADSVRGTTELYGYDSAGRRASALFGYGESLAFEYDQRSRLIGETYYWPGQGAIRSLDFDYDLADRRTGIRDGGVALIESQYAGGRLESTRYGNGLERTFSYSLEDGQLASAQTLNAQSRVVEATTITRQGQTNPLRYEVTAATITSLAATTEVYWMGIGGSVTDPDRLVGNRVWHWEAGGDSADFDYDELSNAISTPSGDQFSYNAERNRLVSATLAAEGETLAYTYDAAGFATSRNGTPITWTATGRMASMGSLSLQWDMLDRPVAWTAGGVTQQFAYFGGRVAANAAGGPGILGLGEVSIELGSAGQRYRHLDFRGNVSFVSDETGAVVTHYRYSPYGLDAVYGSGADAVRFVGRHEVGALMVLGARMYDPAIGRFLSPDPILQLFNQYGYALGNPVWFIDQDGTEGASGVDAAAAFANATGLLGGLFLVTPGFEEVGVVLVGFAIGVHMGIALYNIGQAINGGAAVGGPISGSGAASGCAPARLTDVGDMGFVLKFLVPLQILLGIALAIRQRARVRRSIRGSLTGWT